MENTKDTEPNSFENLLEELNEHSRGQDILKFCRKWISLPMNEDTQRLINEEINTLKLDDNECLGSHIVQDPFPHIELKFIRQTEFSRLCSLYFLYVSRLIYTLVEKLG